MESETAVTIQEVLDFLTTPSIDSPDTVDRLLFGHPSDAVTAIATTHVATQEMIEKARDKGCNLIISHEGIFYIHRGSRPGIESDMTYQNKLRAIQESGVAIFRNHDHVHRQSPDIVTEGLLQVLGWGACETDKQQVWSIVEIPGMTVRELALHIRNSLGLPIIRYIGDDDAVCRRIGVLVGYRGTGDLLIPLLEKENLDAVLCGEGPEWETPEYVRDAVWQGRRKALFVLGHAESEMPGMALLAKRLKIAFPDVPVKFFPQEPVFQRI